jgi:hypothetical protein
MNGTELQLPVIVMDGAALYDVKEKQYLDMTYLSPTVSAEARCKREDKPFRLRIRGLYVSESLLSEGFKGKYDVETEGVCGDRKGHHIREHPRQI